jgi:hypothetical protein
LCRVCYEYQQRGRGERPSYLWGVDSLGWCDCGRPARHKIAVTIRSHTDTLMLCDDCYAEELEMEREYGLKHTKKDT